MGAPQQLFIGGMSEPISNPEPSAVVIRQSLHDTEPARWVFRFRSASGRRLGSHPGEGVTRAVAEAAAREIAGRGEQLELVSAKAANPAAVEADELEEWRAESERLRPRTRGECHAARRRLANVGPAEPLPPCPWVSCHYHLWGRWQRPDGLVEIGKAREGRGQRPDGVEFGLMVEDLAPEDWGETCSLDVADAVDAGVEPGRPGPKAQTSSDGAREWNAHPRSSGRKEMDDHAAVGRHLGISREQVRLDELHALREDVVSALFEYAGRVGPELAGRVTQRLVSAWTASGMTATELVDRAGVSLKIVERIQQLAALPRVATRAHGLITVKIRGTATLGPKTMLRSGATEYLVVAKAKVVLETGAHEVEVKAVVAGALGNLPRGSRLTFVDPPEGARETATAREGLTDGEDDASMHGLALGRDVLARIADALGLTIPELLATSRPRRDDPVAGLSVVAGLVHRGLISTERQLAVQIDMLTAHELEPDLLACRIVELLWADDATEIFATDVVLLAAVKAELAGDSAATTDTLPLLFGSST